MMRHVNDYSARLRDALSMPAMDLVPTLREAVRAAWVANKSVYLCGNGGSAANAVHIANDWLFAARGRDGASLRVEALCANTAVMTSIANDLGYELVYAEQLRVKAEPGDLLVALSGSGNSPNVLRALETGNEKGMTTFAVVAFSGGGCRALAKHAMHFETDDMQVAEDLQLIVGHMCMQWLCANPVVR